MIHSFANVNQSVTSEKGGVTRRMAYHSIATTKKSGMERWIDKQYGGGGKGDNQVNIFSSSIYFILSGFTNSCVRSIQVDC